MVTLDGDRRLLYVSPIFAPEKIMKSIYARQCFGLPVEQIKTFDKLTKAQQEAVYWHFGRQNPGNFIYAVKRSSDLVEQRERKRPEWGTV